MKKLLMVCVFSFGLFFSVTSSVVAEKLVSSMQGQDTLGDTGVFVNNKLSWRDKAMFWTVKQGLFRLTKFFIENGADIRKQDEDGRTVLMYAVAQGNIELVRLLILAGADVNWRYKDGSTALKRAVERGNDKIVRLLLEAGADTEMRYKYGRTVLMEAAMNGKDEIVALLLKAGADVNSRDFGELGLTVLMYAVSFEGTDKTVKLLLDAGADINAQDNYGRTVLQNAVLHAHPHVKVIARFLIIVRLLILAGADVNKQDNAGWTALMHAVGDSDIELARLLLDFGADVNIPDSDGNTAITITKHVCDREKMIKLLLAAGAHAEDMNRRTVAERLGMWYQNTNK